MPVVGFDTPDILRRAGTLIDLIVLIGLIDASDLVALAALAGLAVSVPADGLTLAWVGASAWVGALGRLGTFGGLGGLEVLTLQEALSVSGTRGRAGAMGRTAALGPFDALASGALVPLVRVGCRVGAATAATSLAGRNGFEVLFDFFE